MNRLLEKLSNKNGPVYVPIKIDRYSTKDNCFHNVLDKVTVDKGQIIYGWKIHKTSFLDEAERHAVWKSPDGELIDLTPDQAYKDKILFLEEDNGWKYDGVYVDNVRINSTNNALVDDFILLSETITKLWRTGKRKSKTEITLLSPIAKTVEFLEKDKATRENYIRANNNIDSECYCGQPIKYKDCHGLDLENVFKDIISRANEVVEKNTSR